MHPTFIRAEKYVMEKIMLIRISRKRPSNKISWINKWSIKNSKIFT